MIDFLKQRKLRKQLKEYLHAARHARHMREDIADPKDIEALKAAEANLREIRDTGQGNVEKAVERLSAAADKVYPSVNTSGIRENVEVIIVALAAAMAIRAFFFQPFKIPTGSMQPTLNGITIKAQAEAGFMDRQPLKFVKWLFTGESYKEVRAKASGSIRSFQPGRDAYIVEIGGEPHKVPVYMVDRGWRPDGSLYYKKGDVICGAKVIAGDHILVNKMKYNFMRPERGDIAVFDTKNIEHSQVRADTFYIKRMVGLSGEKIQIQNGRIVADGKMVSEPPVFEKIATDPAYNGGHGNAGRLLDPDAFIQLADDQYLMMGDNTKPSMSLDGRFFGGVRREDFQGPAFFVYWPFRSHWGIVR
ncbi:MAG: signal peptidase I [Verrucomicrobia bacterium]|nr:signal peptidase I [Verrucomicrobiota bacterium]